MISFFEAIPYKRLSLLLCTISWAVFWVVISYETDTTQLLVEPETYMLSDVLNWTFESWSTNPEVPWWNGYCSLIARKNQQSLATLFDSWVIVSRWHAIDLIRQWLQDTWKYRKGSWREVEQYFKTANKWIYDVYSYVEDENQEVVDPEEVSYQSPHRFTMMYYNDTLTVLDPLRGEKSLTPQQWERYLWSHPKHIFMIKKAAMPIAVTHIQEQSPVVYTQSFISSLIIHFVAWNIEQLQWSDYTQIWVYFKKPFQYVTPTWDLLTIDKSTVIRLWEHIWPYRARNFLWSQWEVNTFFGPWDRFTIPWRVEEYEYLF